MKLWVYGVLGGSLILSACTATADTALDKAADAAHQVGRTASHSAKGVGHGAAKVYHDAARRYHKTIALNSDNPHRRAKHMRKAMRHRHLATQQSGAARREMHRAHVSAHQ